MIFRARHLQEKRLFDCYLAVRGGEALDPPVADHLADCPQCGQRYAELSQFMESLSVAADEESDAIFTPERLRLQQQQIARRLEHLGQAARVISFPGRTAGHQIGAVAPRFARRWVAASLAAGLFIGVAMIGGFSGPGEQPARLVRIAPIRATPGRPRGPLRVTTSPRT